MITMSQQMKDINKPMKIVFFKKKQIEILELRNTVNEIKNSLEGFNIFELAKIIKGLESLE